MVVGIYSPSVLIPFQHCGVPIPFQAFLHSRADLVETHLKPHLLEGKRNRFPFPSLTSPSPLTLSHSHSPAHQQHLSLLSSLTSTLTKHTARLQVVREVKRKKQETLLGTQKGTNVLRHIIIIMNITIKVVNSLKGCNTVV